VRRAPFEKKSDTMRKFVIAFLFISTTAFGQENKFVDYLKNNRAVLDLKGDNQWDMLKTDAEQNQFIILGESHGAQAAQLIDFSLLKYLNKTVGTKNYIAELDFAQAAAINEYLRTGDKALLKTVFRTWVKRHAQWGNADFYKKIVKISQLNKTLPKQKQITFIGVDQIQDFTLYFNFLKKFIADKQSPLLDSIKLISTTNLNDSSFEDKCLFATTFLEKIEQNKIEFSKLFGEQLPLFEYLIQNLSHSDNAAAAKRPQYLFQNFSQLYTILHLEDQKLYGMWGYFHSHQVPIYFLGEDFASKLISSDLPVSKKLITIVCMPVDSKYNVWDEKTGTWTKMPFSYDLKTLFQVDGMEDVKQLSTNSPTTLFKLNGPNSPFPRTGRLFNGVSPQGRLMGDFRKRDLAYQYLVIIRNSDWLEPLPNTF
jgi:hypothetical protein